MCPTTHPLALHELTHQRHQFRLLTHASRIYPTESERLLEKANRPSCVVCRKLGEEGAETDGLSTRLHQPCHLDLITLQRHLTSRLTLSIPCVCVCACAEEPFDGGGVVILRGGVEWCGFGIVDQPHLRALLEQPLEHVHVAFRCRPVESRVPNEAE